MTKSADVNASIPDMSWMVKLESSEWTLFKARYKEFQKLNLEIAKELMEMQE